MSIDGAFILSAGRGTRMGEVGKLLPKPLWPIFETTLLGLQIELLDFLGLRRILLNTHHKHHLIQQYCAKFYPEVEILHERALLGSGGAIHNLKKERPELERVLLINADIFFLLERKEWERFLKSSLTFDHCLAGLSCSFGSGYNELVLSSEGEFIKVIPPSGKRTYTTYSGMGIINLNKIGEVEGESRFFETVIRENGGRTKVFAFEEYEYWDFGTKKLYIENFLKKLNSKTLLGSFLLEKGLKSSMESYFSADTLTMGCLKIDINQKDVEKSVIHLL